MKKLKGIKGELDELWKQYIHLRDKVCQRCGSSKSLQAHHIFIRKRHSTRWDVSNGVLLCTGCHQHVENNHDVAWEFATKRLGVKVYDTLRLESWTPSHFKKNHHEELKRDLQEKLGEL